MNAWKVIFPTLVIFIAGVITGGLLVNYTMRVQDLHPKPAAVSSGGGGGAGTMNPWLLRSQELLKRMDRELDLSPEQHTHIEDILKQSQVRIKAIFRPVAPLMSTEMQQVRSQIAKELTPEQRKKFEGFTKRRPGPGGRHMATNAPAITPGTNAVSTNTAQ